MTLTSGSSEGGVELTTTAEASTDSGLRIDYSVRNDSDGPVVIIDRLPPNPRGIDQETFTVVEFPTSDTAVLSKRLFDPLGAPGAPVDTTGRIIAPGDELTGTGHQDLPLRLIGVGFDFERPLGDEVPDVQEWRFCLGVVPLSAVREAESATGAATGTEVAVRNPNAEQFLLCSDPEAMPG